MLVTEAIDGMEQGRLAGTLTAWSGVWSCVSSFPVVVGVVGVVGH